MKNIFEFTSLYRRTVTGKGLTGSTVRILLDRVHAKTLRVLTHVTVEDKTSAYTKVRLGIATAGQDHYLDELDTLSADELAVSTSDILLGERDIFFAELTGTTTNDELVLTAIGWELDL